MDADGAAVGNTNVTRFCGDVGPGSGEDGEVYGVLR